MKRKGTNDYFDRQKIISGKEKEENPWISKTSKKKT